MKLQNSLIPNRLKPDRTKKQTINAGNAESIRNFANTPGLTHIFGKSQLLQVSTPSQPFTTGTGLFRGLESNRIDDHQKYRLGVRWISRSTRNEWSVSAP